VRLIGALGACASTTPWSVRGQNAAGGARDAAWRSAAPRLERARWAGARSGDAGQARTAWDGGWASVQGAVAGQRALGAAAGRACARVRAAHASGCAAARRAARAGLGRGGSSWCTAGP
jgi:hypothetical protein